MNRTHEATGSTPVCSTTLLLGGRGSRPSSHGFTLLELMAVIMIIGVLAGVSTPQYRRALERARSAEAYSDLATLQRAEKLHYLTAGTYLTGKAPLSPDVQRKLDVALPQKGWAFEITSKKLNEDFLVTARRTKGPCEGITISVTHQGILTEKWWQLCLDLLSSQ